MNTDYKLSFLT